jgi:hypothetical protein
MIALGLVLLAMANGAPLGIASGVLLVVLGGVVSRYGRVLARRDRVDGSAAELSLLEHGVQLHDRAHPDEPALLLPYAGLRVRCTTTKTGTSLFGHATVETKIAELVSRQKRLVLSSHMFQTPKHFDAALDNVFRLIKAVEPHGLGVSALDDVMKEPTGIGPARVRIGIDLIAEELRVELANEELRALGEEETTKRQRRPVAKTWHA